MYKLPSCLTTKALVDSILMLKNKISYEIVNSNS